MAFVKNRQDADAWQAKLEDHTPRVGEEAPDFELSDIRGEERVRLSTFEGKRPVALVFGSFT